MAIAWLPVNQLENRLLIPNPNIGGLAEIALRVNDLDSMAKFYQTVIGLELMKRSEWFVFFRIATGFAGHTQVLALFNRSQQIRNSGGAYVAPDNQRTSVDHLAFAITKESFQSERQRLIQLGFDVQVTYHDWVQWRSLYLFDPEGNLVELVCFDPPA